MWSARALNKILFIERLCAQNIPSPSLWKKVGRADFWNREASVWAGLDVFLFNGDKCQFSTWVLRSERTELWLSSTFIVKKQVLVPRMKSNSGQVIHLKPRLSKSTPTPCIHLTQQAQCPRIFCHLMIVVSHPAVLTALSAHNADSLSPNFRGFCLEILSSRGWFKMWKAFSQCHSSQPYFIQNRWEIYS